jgi:maleate isomerase
MIERLCNKMRPTVRLGMLTPSSNTVLEPMTYNIISCLPNVTAHFSRFRVVGISLEQEHLGQFDDDIILTAAERLAEAHVDIIAWNGTSSGWLGFERDEDLCRRITQATGIPATTSMLALNEILAATKVKNYGLVTPYIDGVQRRILDAYEHLGFHCAAEAHLGLQDNFSFAAVDDETIQNRVAEVAAAKPDAIVIICTNLRAAHLVAPLERQYGIPVYDTIATAVWKSLQIAGIPTTSITGWGKLFNELPHAFALASHP